MSKGKDANMCVRVYSCHTVQIKQTVYKHSPFEIIPHIPGNKFNMAFHFKPVRVHGQGCVYDWKIHNN